MYTINPREVTKKILPKTVIVSKPTVEIKWKNKFNEAVKREKLKKE